ncbi:hypothetical protein N1851_025831 [Merluccius polli]|uniref:Uncharacterized protein n=1 Tax=Merluccius polli TaxID=89951 RepID=A0AA47MCX3_MERPO|nr:hypothetical protein N1851_025831 [Merluccius polli]
MLQSRVNQDSPTTSRVLRNSGRTSSTPGALPPRSFLTTSATSAPEIGGPTSESPGPASLPEGMSVGLRRSSKYSFHRSTTSRVEVSSAPSPPYTVLTMHCFPLLRRRMVVQNLFEAVRKSFSMASPNSSHVRVFASVTATAALRLACRYLPAASGVPQAKKFDGIPHRRCPPAGSGIAATAGTDHLAATALVGRLNNGGVEHGPLGLNVPRLPRYMVKALPEVGVEALSDRRLCQTFPADPHDTFGSASSAPLFARVSKTCGRKSDDTTTKSIIELRPRVSWCQAQTTVRIRPPTRRRREATLSSTGVNSNILAPSRGAISIATPARRLSPVATPEWKRVQLLSRRLVPEPLLCVEVRPTISSRNFSTSRTSSGSFPTREVTFHVPRASFCSRGSDRQGPRLRPPPSSHCTRPLWPLLLVVSRREVGPTSSFRAVPGRAPPGHQALAAEPHPQAWLQGEAPTIIKTSSNIHLQSRTEVPLPAPQHHSRASSSVEESISCDAKGEEEEWNLFQRLVYNMFRNEKGELDWGLQVEPQEDLDVTSYDIDPRMKIWQSVVETGPGGKYQTAEEDLDELHHPSMVDVVPINQDISDAVPDKVVWNEAEEKVRRYLAPLAGNIGHSQPEDMDDMYHGDDLLSAVQVDVPAPVGSDLMGQPQVRLHLEPEEDMDDLFHADQRSDVQMDVPAPVGSDVREQMSVGLHSEPEEDMDDLYHRDQVLPVAPYQGPADTPDAVQLRGPLSSDRATQRTGSEPEEDMDDLYHQ